MRATILVSTLLLPAGLVYAQKFTNPDTLAPDFPTPQVVVDRMLALANVKPGEVVYDLGCGDGRILISAVRNYHCRAVGVELSRDIYDRTCQRIKTLGLSDQISVIHGNVLHTDFSPADVVTLYLMTSTNERLKPLMEQYLKPGARVVSHDYEIHGWKPLKEETVSVDGRPHKVYLYVMKPKH
jgi:ubiquinone/menaquinone biosynthesis C-methylase UbiE